MNIRPDDRIPISVGFFREQSFSAQTGPLETTDASGPLWPYYTAISRIPWRMLGILCDAGVFEQNRNSQRGFVPRVWLDIRPGLFNALY